MWTSIAATPGRIFTQVANQHIITDIDDVPFRALTQPLAALVDPPELGIGRDPGVRDILALIHLIKKDLPGLLVHHVVRDAGGAAAFFVFGPLPGEEQTMTEQGVAVAAAIAEEDP